MFSEITGDEDAGPEAIKEVWQSELSKEKLKQYHGK